MVAVPYKVYVVVEREFGEQLAKLPPDAPIWIVNTPPNRAVAERLWKERNQEGHLTGITTFNDLKLRPLRTYWFRSSTQLTCITVLTQLVLPIPLSRCSAHSLATESRLNSLSTGSMNFTPTPQVSALCGQCLPLKQASRLPFARGVKYLRTRIIPDP
jgi:hypothetical protein